MATTQCKGCGRQINTQLITCSDCGTPVGVTGSAAATSVRSSLTDSTLTSSELEEMRTEIEADTAYFLEAKESLARMKARAKRIAAEEIVRDIELAASRFT